MSLWHTPWQCFTSIFESATASVSRQSDTLPQCCSICWWSCARTRACVAHAVPSTPSCVLTDVVSLLHLRMRAERVFSLVWDPNLNSTDLRQQQHATISTHFCSRAKESQANSGCLHLHHTSQPAGTRLPCTHGPIQHRLSGLLGLTAPGTVAPACVHSPAAASGDSKQAAARRPAQHAAQPSRQQQRACLHPSTCWRAP